MSAHVDREAEYPGTEVRHSYGYAAQIHILGLFGISLVLLFVFFFQAEDGIRDVAVTGVQTCALPISHVFEVAAEDVDGNIDPTPASWTWTVVEGTAPDTVISGGPDDPTTATTASFGFFSTETNSTFICSLDGGAAEVCTSPAQYTGLAIGNHEFQVTATDEEGAPDPTPATYRWTIGPPDTTDPVTLLVHMPPASTQSTTASFTFTSEEGATFECALDGGPFGGCTSPYGYNGLVDGVHTFAVRAT